jgi:hypothetical protein
MAANLAVMAANALRNDDLDRAFELLEQICAVCDPERPRNVLGLTAVK